MGLDEGYIEATAFSFSNDVPSPPDRRENQRHVTILRIGKLITSRSQELCLVRNISSGGLMLHVYSPRTVGERVEVELKTGHRLRGVIRWVRDANVGVMFDEQVNVADVLANPALFEDGTKPRAPRLDVSCNATVRAGAQLCQVGVCDISQGGAKIATDRSFLPDEQVVITLAGFRPMAATIRWCGNGFAGVGFNQLLPFDELTNWLNSVCN